MPKTSLSRQAFAITGFLVFLGACTPTQSAIQTATALSASPVTPTLTPTPGHTLSEEAAMMCNYFYDVDLTGKYDYLTTDCTSDEKPDTITHLDAAQFEVHGFCIVRNKNTLVEWENEYTCQVKQIAGGKWNLLSLSLQDQ